MARIAYWGPYSGHIGTIKAQINSGSAMHHFGGHDVTLVRAHSEFLGQERTIAEKGLKLIDLGLSRWFPGLQNSSLLARRPYMLVCAVFGFLPLVAYLRRERPDILICNLITAPAIIAANVSGVRLSVVVSVQGYPRFLGLPAGQTIGRWKGLEERLRKRIWRQVYRRADRIVCLTEQTRKRIADALELDADKLSVVPNPIVDDQLLSLAAQEIRHPWLDQHLIPVICGVGRLVIQKGFDTLIRAVAIVREQMPVRLLILGEGEERGPLEKLVADLGVGDAVQFMGFCVNPFAFMKRSDLFVLSSRWEDPGHAIIEAAALEVPIVTTDCPNGPSELVSFGSAGLICKTGDERDMAAKIIEALRRPDRGRINLARANAQRFTPRSHYEALSHVLELPVT